MLVQIAAVMVALLGMVGLAVDVGFVTLERHALQNGADAAAQTGAIVLAQRSSTRDTGDDARTMVARNQVTGTLERTLSLACTYVELDANNNSVSGSAAPNCDASPTSGSNAVRVVATYVRKTYFMRVLNIPTVTVSAESTARIAGWQRYDAAATLFVACGYGTRLSSRDPIDPNGRLNLLQGTSPGTPPWNVNPNAVGRYFNIHGSQAEDCGRSGGWDGLVPANPVPPALRDPANPTLISLPSDLLFNNGNSVGPTRRTVYGIDGCEQGRELSSAYNCVMLVPIAIPYPNAYSVTPGSSDRRIYAVRWLPFLMYTGDNGGEAHYGKLLSTNYVVRQDLPNSLGSTSVGPVSARTVK